MKIKTNKMKLIFLPISVLTITSLFMSACDGTGIDIVYPADPAPVIQQVEEELISISSENVDQEIFGKYDSNCGTFTIDDVEYEGYKIGADAEDDNEIFVLKTVVSSYGIDALPASFANVDPLEGVSSISITYESDSDFHVLYGNDRNHLEYEQEIPESKDYVTYDVDFLMNATYFRIEADDDYLSVKSLEIACIGESADETQEYYVLGKRYIPDTDYNPKEGEVLSAPNCQLDEDGNITKVIWKEYTYHSFDYAIEEIEHGADLEEFAITNPADVANYFVLFNRIPVNYGLSVNYDVDTIIQGDVRNVDEVYEVFGRKYTRQVSEYSRDDGYVSKVPAAISNDTQSGALYYEFDIDVDGKYSTRNRGTGRVVGFVGGFYTNEDSTNVAVFTDDHYYTFCEYNNCGFWGERFDAMGVCRTGKLIDMKNQEEIVIIE